MRGKATPEEIRAEVIAALMAGLGVSEAARKYRLSTSVVSRIKAEISTELEQVGKAHREKLDDLLYLSLASNLQAQTAITRIAQDENYLRKQDASALGSLYERLATHSLRLLEAAEAAHGEDPDEDFDEADDTEAAAPAETGETAQTETADDQAESGTESSPQG